MLHIVVVSIDKGLNLLKPNCLWPIFTSPDVNKIYRTRKAKQNSLFQGVTINRLGQRLIVKPILML